VHCGKGTKNQTGNWLPLDTVSRVRRKPKGKVEERRAKRPLANVRCKV
jgi:hypothetical protein